MYSLSRLYNFRLPCHTISCLSAHQCRNQIGSSSLALEMRRLALMWRSIWSHLAGGFCSVCKDLAATRTPFEASALVAHTPILRFDMRRGCGHVDETDRLGTSPDRALLRNRSPLLQRARRSFGNYRAALSSMASAHASKGCHCIPPWFRESPRVMSKPYPGE